MLTTLAAVRKLVVARMDRRDVTPFQLTVPGEARFGETIAAWLRGDTVELTSASFLILLDRLGLVLVVGRRPVADVRRLAQAAADAEGIGALARRCEITASSLSRYLGHDRSLRLGNFLRLCRGLGVTIGEK